MDTTTTARCPRCTLPKGPDRQQAESAEGWPCFHPFHEGLAEREVKRCPTCKSPRPGAHPATSEGGEVQPCKDPYHPPLTPELDRQSAAIADGAHRIGEFLDWLESEGYHLGRYSDSGRAYDAGTRPLELVAGFYNIDLNKIEQERMMLLEHLRSQQHA